MSHQMSGRPARVELVTPPPVSAQRGHLVCVTEKMLKLPHDMVSRSLHAPWATVKLPTMVAAPVVSGAWFAPLTGQAAVPVSVLLFKLQIFCTAT